MADDINKKITIEVEAQTDKLQQNIAGLNQVINELQANQQKLIDSGEQDSATFEKTAAAIEKYQKQLSAATKQLSSFNSGLKSSAASLKTSQSAADALAKANDKLSKSISDGATKLKQLDTGTKALSSTTQVHSSKAKQSKTVIDAHNKSMAEGASKASSLKKSIDEVSSGLKDQETRTKNSKATFSAHKAITKELEQEFDKLKGTTGEFGPLLSQAANGFNFLKNGLDIAQGGFKGIGAAIKETGFGWLLQILESVVEYFAHTTEGTKILHGVFSAIGVVVNKVNGVIDFFKKIIIDALTHPIESIKALGRTIMENIINRFTAFSVILDGIIHLDFKKIGDGVLQAATGVTHATDKIAGAFKTMKKEVVNTAGQIVNA